jgi:hypothetical protein
VKQILLIQLFCTVCRHYRNTLAAQAQRLSNNYLSKFTDEECITIYLFGIREGKFDVKAIYTFIMDYWHDWFPNLPAYQNFNRRINYLARSIQTLSGLLLEDRPNNEFLQSHLVDSLPIIVANARRSGSAKAAQGLCQKGYCASKGLYYYGVKLHVVGQKQYKTLPKVRMALVTSAAENDITVAKEWLEEPQNMDIFADKAYADATWAAHLREKNVHIYTPVKS